MLNKRGSKIGLWGTVNKISSHEVCDEFVLVLFLRFDKEPCTNISESILNPHAFNFAMKRLCKR